MPLRRAGTSAGQTWTRRRRWLATLIGVGALALAAFFLWAAYGFWLDADAASEHATGVKVGPVLIPLGSDSYDVMALVICGIAGLFFVFWGVTYVVTAIRGR